MSAFSEICIYEVKPDKKTPKRDLYFILGA
jgi:hypothetical protein